MIAKNNAALLKADCTRLHDILLIKEKTAVGEEELVDVYVPGSIGVS